VRSESKTYQGETPELNAVLGLMSERLDYGVTFDVFQERLKNHVLKTFKRADDVVIRVTDLTDLNTDFEMKNKPMDSTSSEIKNPIKMEEWKMRFKQYMSQEEISAENVTKLYVLVIGQCTPALRSSLKAELFYKIKSESSDSLWLLNSLKSASSGMDFKANKALTLHEQLLTFLTTRQGQNKSDDDYLMHFNSRYRNLEMAGGAHVMCSPTLLGKEVHTADPDELSKEVERFKAMCFLLLLRMSKLIGYKCTSRFRNRN